jgi:hypothetical protein
MIATYTDHFEFSWKKELETLKPDQVELILEDKREDLTLKDLRIFVAHCNKEIRRHTCSDHPSRTEISEWNRLKRQILRRLTQGRGTTGTEDSADVASDDSQRQGASA